MSQKDKELSTLCQNCGLCCDGSLFTHVSLQPTEAEPLSALGLLVRKRQDGAPVLLQPCAALKDRCCTAYDQRPTGCRLYQCHLFSALAEGEVSFNEALDVVVGAQDLLDASDGEKTDKVKDYLDQHFRGRHRRYTAQ